MNYNTHLCNTAWGKKLLARVTQCTCFCVKNRDSNFLGELARSGSRRVKRLFTNERKKNDLSTENLISEINQAKT